MSMPHIRKEVAMLLAAADAKISDAEAQLAKGSLRGKVNAAGELAFLTKQKETLERRLEAIDADPTASERVLAWIKEEWLGLTIRLESWSAPG